jgi:hypothetical protein
MEADADSRPALIRAGAETLPPSSPVIKANEGRKPDERLKTPAPASLHDAAER